MWFGYPNRQTPNPHLPHLPQVCCRPNVPQQNVHSSHQFPTFTAPSVQVHSHPLGVPVLWSASEGSTTPTPSPSTATTSASTPLDTPTGYQRTLPQSATSKRTVLVKKPGTTAQPHQHKFATIDARSALQSQISPPRVRVVEPTTQPHVNTQQLPSRCKLVPSRPANQVASGRRCATPGPTHSEKPNVSPRRASRCVTPGPSRAERQISPRRSSRCVTPGPTLLDKPMSPRRECVTPGAKLQEKQMSPRNISRCVTPGPTRSDRQHVTPRRGTRCTSPGPFAEVTPSRASRCTTPGPNTGTHAVTPLGSPDDVQRVVNRLHAQRTHAYEHHLLATRQRHESTTQSEEDSTLMTSSRPSWISDTRLDTTPKGSPSARSPTSTLLDEPDVVRQHAVGSVNEVQRVIDRLYAQHTVASSGRRMTRGPTRDRSPTGGC